MISTNEIKAAFAKAGIKVRVKALYGSRFRICTLSGEPHSSASFNAAASIGLTDAAGFLGGNINQAHEMFCTAPGIIRRIAA